MGMGWGGMAWMGGLELGSPALSHVIINVNNNVGSARQEGGISSSIDRDSWSLEADHARHAWHHLPHPPPTIRRGRGRKGNGSFVAA